tara:strand:+ start:73243 stop:73389 length:147 start_codon:yes stop_codon:yes gene_type:complete
MADDFSAAAVFEEVWAVLSPAAAAAFGDFFAAGRLAPPPCLAAVALAG